MILSFLTYIRSPFLIIYCLLVIVVWGFVFFLNALLMRGESVAIKNVNRFSKILIRGLGLNFKIEGDLDFIPKQAIFMFNHTSLLDIPILQGMIPVKLRFIAKKELLRIPIWGLLLKLHGTFVVDRNAEKPWEVYNKIKEEVGDGFYMMVSPEGGRRCDGKTLAPFKSGPFIFAIESQLPIVPIVIQGVKDVLPRKSLRLNVGKWKREVVLKILPPVDVSNYDIDARGELKSKVHHLMAEALHSGV